MPTNPDPTPPPLIVAAGLTAQGLPTQVGLPLKLHHLQESINELQQQLSEIIDELNRSGKPSK